MKKLKKKHREQLAKDLLKKRIENYDKLTDRDKLDVIYKYLLIF